MGHDSATRSASVRATIRAKQAHWACDFCEAVTGNVRTIGLVGQAVDRTRRNPSGSLATVSRGAGSLRLCEDCWRSIGKACDSCGEAARRTTVRRYALRVHRWKGKESFDHPAAGSTYLCDRCWRTIAAKRMRRVAEHVNRRVVA